ncbi:hypothetical protein [Achromobacter sp. UMC46]|uniref:hypothetical protein n=1 Tax=Achromobacter sp. UMC46 TaxID=1862319 RepID=UPI0016045EFB|nr:hypothetical protein [Achromobacter sp. UMC46]MBB1593567.1 hypothetical protein [Achromobacter sp. UMC46]
MGAPESSTSQDAALSSLLSAAIGSPETSVPVSSIQAAQHAYATPGAVAQRIEQYIGRYGRENTSTLLLYEAMKALRNPAALALPELNADLIDILGRPNFTCIRLAQLLRLSGVEIATKAEAEQATVIHYLLGFYLKHGSQWAEKADEDLEQRRVAAIAAQQDKGGT